MPISDDAPTEPTLVPARAATIEPTERRRESGVEPGSKQSVIVDFTRPLDSTEWDELEAAVVRAGSMDFVEMSGALHAIAITPTFLSPAVWAPLLFGPRHRVDMANPDRLTVLAARAMIEVSGWYERRTGLSVPPADDDAVCAAFARGFVRAAQLDRTWMSTPRALLLLTGPALLAGRRELVEPQLAASFDRDPTARRCLCEDLEAHLYAMADFNWELRTRADASDGGREVVDEAEHRRRAFRALARDPAQAPIAALVETGETLDPSLRETIAALGARAVPGLVAILEHPDLSDEAGASEGRPAIHAARLLGELRSTDAIEPLLGALARSPKSDLLHSAIILALGSFGQPALEPTLAALARMEDPGLRDSLVDVLTSLGVRDERVYRAICEVFGRVPGLGAMFFEGYGDARAIPRLLAAIASLEPYESADDFELGLLVVALDALGGALDVATRVRIDRRLADAKLAGAGSR